MNLASKLREALLGLRAGQVTLPYPVGGPGRPVPAAFRGRPRFDARRCIGCAGCASNCPAREILVFDVCQEIRVLQYLGRRCTFCGRCAEVCPEQAVTLSPDFESATASVTDLRQRLEIFMSTCQRCGRCFPPPNPLAQLKRQGYRFDDLAQERWIPLSRATLEPDPVSPDVPIELD